MEESGVDDRVGGARVDGGGGLGGDELGGGVLKNQTGFLQFGDFCDCFFLLGPK